MKHARKDYDKIQDGSGKIPDDEPVFLVRAQDVVGPMTVRAWARNAELVGAEDDIIAHALEHAMLMEDWQDSYGRKVPDMPK